METSKKQTHEIENIKFYCQRLTLPTMEKDTSLNISEAKSPLSFLLHQNFKIRTRKKEQKSNPRPCPIYKPPQEKTQKHPNSIISCKH